MKNLFDASTGEEILGRLMLLRHDSVRLWGKMNAAQAMAHCVAGMEMALGDIHPPRKLVGRLIGGMIKPMALGDDMPMRRNSPTAESLVVNDQRDISRERERLSLLIHRFVDSGRAGCSKYPHPFFGPLTPDEWAILTYKHLDHHLRQFGA